MPLRSLLYLAAVTGVLLTSLLVAACDDHRLDPLTYLLYAEAASPVDVNRIYFVTLLTPLR